MAVLIDGCDADGTRYHNVIIHIPKCGGDWVEKAVASALHPKTGSLTWGGSPSTGDPFYRHTDLSRLINVGAVTNARHVCAFVRQPHTWYRSLWMFRRFKAGWDMRSPVVQKCHDDDWGKFVEKVVESGIPFFSRMVKEMLVGVTFIGRQESLMRDLITFLEITGMPYDRESLVATPRSNYALRNPEDYPYPDDLYQALVQLEGYVYDAFYADLRAGHQV